MPTSPNRCQCGRPATCWQCNSCILHCLCPTPDELAEQHRQQVNRHRQIVLKYIERHLGDWVWSNRGQTILWDVRRNHVGFYLAQDRQGGLWWNKYYGDGRGMVEYNYGARPFQGNAPL